MPKDKSSRECNMSNGPEAKAANAKRKSATSHARGTRQPRGNAENGAKARKAKMQSRNAEDMEF